MYKRQELERPALATITFTLPSPTQNLRRLTPAEFCQLVPRCSGCRWPVVRAPSPSCLACCPLGFEPLAAARSRPCQLTGFGAHRIRPPPASSSPSASARSILAASSVADLSGALADCRCPMLLALRGRASLAGRLSTVAAHPPPRPALDSATASFAGVLSAAAPAPDWRLPTDCAGLLPPLVVLLSRRRLPRTA